jgi:hypothetical protein
MARAKTTVYLDAELLTAARVAAARLGKKDYEVFEDALRSYLGVDVLDRIWKNATLREEEALDLAYKEVRASRRSSRNR